MVGAGPPYRQIDTCELNRLSNEMDQLYQLMRTLIQLRVKSPISEARETTQRMSTMVV